MDSSRQASHIITLNLNGRIKLNGKMRKGYVKSLVFMTLSILSLELLAIEYSYIFDTSYADSSNISQRVEGDGGQSFDFGLGFSLENSLQKEWDLNLSGRVSKTQYSETDLGDEKISSLDGIVIYRAPKNNFSFTSLASVAVAPINRFATEEINNARDQTVYAFMPSYFIALNPMDRVNVSYTFVDFNLEDVEGVPINQAQSSEDTNWLVNYSKNLNATNIIALNIRKAKTDFDEGIEVGAFDYDRDDIFISWSVNGLTNQLQSEWGTSEITDVLSRKLKLDHQLFSYTRQLNSSSEIRFLYDKGFNNPLSSIQANNEIIVNQQNNNIAAAQEVKQYSFSYTFSRESFSVNARFSNGERRQSFTENIEDRKEVGANMTYFLSRIIENSGRSNIVLNYSKLEGEFESLVTNVLYNEVSNMNFTYNHVYSRNLTFSLSYVLRDSTQLDNFGGSFIADSKSTFFTITYLDRGRF